MPITTTVIRVSADTRDAALLSGLFPGVYYADE